MWFLVSKVFFDGVQAIGSAGELQWCKMSTYNCMNKTMGYVVIDLSGGLLGDVNPSTTSMRKEKILLFIEKPINSMRSFGIIQKQIHAGSTQNE